MQSSGGGSVDDQIVPGTHCRLSAVVTIGPPSGSGVGDEAVEVAVRALIVGGAGDRQQAFVGDSAVLSVDTLGDRCGHRVVVVFVVRVGGGLPDRSDALLSCVSFISC